MRDANDTWEFSGIFRNSFVFAHHPAMSDQEDRRQDDQVEPQQHEVQQHVLQVAPLASPQQQRLLLVLQLLQLLAQLARIMVMNRIAAAKIRIPYHTSSLSGEGWVQELLNGHPNRIRAELGVHQSTFTVLLKAIRALGVESSRHVSAEEQLSIFLYTIVTGLSCTHVGECFQRSSSTITK